MVLDETRPCVEPLTNIDVRDLLFFDKNEVIIRYEDYINSPETPGDSSSKMLTLREKNPKKYKRRKNKQCHVCDKNFTTTTKLKMHTRIHSGCKPFKCKKCHKTFSQEFNLKRHEMVHRTDRPREFQCHICGSFYWQKHHLTDHIVACHAKVETIICDICKKCVKNKNSYRLHRYKHVTFMIDNED